MHNERRWEEPLDRARILVIDDDANLRKTLSDILTAKGYEVRAAENGARGLALFDENPINLVLIDLKLPDMSGIEVLNSVKGGSPSTQAIILTGSATLDSAIEAANNGAFSYLQKPYDIEQLLLNIKHALERQKAEEKMVLDNLQLKEMNSELKALYEISRAAGASLDIEKLFPEILDALASAGIFGVERRGGIFLAEKSGLRLVSDIGLPEEIRKSCGSVRPGECLCGMAALTGEILISNDSNCKGRHSLTHADIASHGRVVIPLKTKVKVVGVLCLYTQSDIEVSGSLLERLRSIGDQIGTAVENSMLYDEAKTSSFRDPLTGVGNRRHMQQVMEKCLEMCRRYGGSLSVIMLDIDHFKRYNDRYGHIGGDKLLAGIAGILLTEVRDPDHVFRYGGEEFLVMLPETDLSAACVAAERIRRAVESGGAVTVSLGVSAYREHAQRSEDLIALADEVLYRAKKNGRNRVEATAPGVTYGHGNY